MGTSKNRYFLPNTLAVTDMRSVSKGQLLVLCSFGTESVGEERSREG